MQLERLVYCSRATVPTESLLVIADILAVAQRNNDRDGLTGALAINDGWFLQVIEGASDRVDRLMVRIKADSRHKDVEVLQRQVIKSRLFETWSMASARITPDLRPDLVALVNECRTAPEAATIALAQIVALLDVAVA
ncbi:MAG: hypothetical protein JWR59_488 [Brevundimonas sp.]|nr:hypothetical protein [Brevundimonas sp.]